MMKRNVALLLAILFLSGYSKRLKAQDNVTPSRQKVAIFAPLYLDSAFDAVGNYRYGINFPKFINPGLEFYEGAQLALDSMSKEHLPLEVFVFDTRSASKNLKQQLQEAAADSIQMIIAYTATITEMQQMAAGAQEMKVPFISVNLPNDGGVYNNPFFIMLNSTLKTHIDAIYRYIQKYYALDNIIVFKKKGQIEDLIHSYFEDTGKNTLSVPLKMKYVDLTDSFSIDQVTDQLDSNRHSLCIDGSLDENFGERLASDLASVSKQYPASLMGMPTFDNIDKDFARPEFNGIEIIYSTPFYNPRTDTVSKKIINFFNTKMFARPSDMVLRGYEAVWRFSKLLLKYKKDIAFNISRKEYNVFRDFDIQPVINKKTTTLDYFENKKLFFIKWLNGSIVSVN